VFGGPGGAVGGPVGTSAGSGAGGATGVGGTVFGGPGGDVGTPGGSSGVGSGMVWPFNCGGDDPANRVPPGGGVTVLKR